MPDSGAWSRLGNTTPETDIGVSVVTFNHAPFIAETLDAILGQQTRYTMMIHVGDDGSTDGTREILTSYAKRCPDRLQVHLHERKLGIRANFMSTIERCNSSYIAICDGDDLWTDAEKLEKQVSALEARPEYSTCFHSAQVVDRLGTPKVIVPQAHQIHGSTYGVPDLITNESFFATSSIVFRRPPNGPVFPDWFGSLQNIVDLPMNIVHAARGPMHFIDEVMCIYRSNSSSHAFSARDPIQIWTEAISMFDLVERNTEPTHRGQLVAMQSRNWRRIVFEQQMRGEFDAADASLKEYAEWRKAHGIRTNVETGLKWVGFGARLLPRSVRRRAVRPVAARMGG